MCQRTSKQSSIIFYLWSIGEEIWQFEVNEGGLPSEFAIRHGNEFRFVEINWCPIVSEDDVVLKVLVTLRDVTAIRELHLNNPKQNQEMQAVEKILAIGHSEFPEFYPCQYRFFKPKHGSDIKLRAISRGSLPQNIYQPSQP